MRRVALAIVAFLIALSVGLNVLLGIQLASSRARLGELDAELSQARSRLAQLDARLQEVETELQQARAEAEAARGQARRAEQERDELRQQLERARGGTPTPTPDGATPVPPEVEEAFDAIEDQVAGLRGLPPRGDVPRSFMAKDALRRYLTETIEKDYSPEEREADTRLLRALGLLRPDQDLVQLYLDLLTEQVIGLYDQETKRFYIVGERQVLDPQTRLTFAHEYVHALQDQHFDLQRLLPDDPENNDAALAVRALVEGDATLASFLWARQTFTSSDLMALLAQAGSGGNQQLNRVPRVLREELLFPYERGQQFVQALYDRGGWRAVDEAFRDPPTSTSHILHPEKYLAGDEPETVTLPDLAAAMGQGWRRLDTNTLGELDLRIAVAEYTDEATARRAAEGWDGDRYDLLARDGETLLVLSVVWESPAEAREFAEAYARAVGQRFGDAVSPSSVGSGQLWEGADYAVFLAAREQRTLLVVASSAETARRAVQHVGGGE